MISQKFAIGNVLLVLAALEVTRSQALVKRKFGGLLLEEGVHIGGAPYHRLAAPVRHLHLLLLILPFSPLENIREVNAEDPTEEDDIHGDDDSEPDAADGEDGEGDAVPVHGQPAGHPAEEENAEEEEGGDVEQRVCAIPLRALRLPGDDEELPGVQEHRVHLHHQAEASICHVLPGKGEEWLIWDLAGAHLVLTAMPRQVITMKWCTNNSYVDRFLERTDIK